LVHEQENEKVPDAAGVPVPVAENANVWVAVGQCHWLVLIVPDPLAVSFASAEAGVGDNTSAATSRARVVAALADGRQERLARRPEDLDGVDDDLPVSMSSPKGSRARLMPGASGWQGRPASASHILMMRGHTLPIVVYRRSRVTRDKRWRQRWDGTG
jgi:hypothetical protein